MNICIVNDRFALRGPGGGQYRVLGIARQLREMGFKVTLCCPWFSTSSLYNFPDSPLPKSWIHNQYTNTIQLLQRVRKSGDYDAFLVELPCPVSKGAIALYERLKRKMVFVDFGDVWFSDETREIHRIVSTQFIKGICRRVDRITAATKALQRGLMELTGKSVLYVPCGVNLKLFNPKSVTKLSIPEVEDKLVILYQGTISTFTGCHYLPQLAKRVIARGEVDVVFLVVGGGPLLGWLMEKVERDGLSKHFYFTGNVPHELVPSYIALADLCIALFPPRRDVNLGVFPIKVVEYMAMGKPVISTPIAEVRNIVENNVDGFYCPTEKMGELIADLLGDLGQVRKVGDNARKKIVERYGWETLVSRLVEFWREGK